MGTRTRAQIRAHQTNHLFASITTNNRARISRSMIVMERWTMNMNMASYNNSIIFIAWKNWPTNNSVWVMGSPTIDLLTTNEDYIFWIQWNFSLHRPSFSSEFLTSRIFECMGSCIHAFCEWMKRWRRILHSYRTLCITSLCICTSNWPTSNCVRSTAAARCVLIPLYGIVHR